MGEVSTEYIRKDVLDNGVTLYYFDQTNRYFGDYHRVKIVVSGEIAMDPNYFPLSNGIDHATAVTTLGASVKVERSLESMGVPSSDVEIKRNELIGTFVETSVPYLARADFPGKQIQAELAKRKLSSRSIRTLSFS